MPQFPRRKLLRGNVLAIKEHSYEDCNTPYALAPTRSAGANDLFLTTIRSSPKR